MPDIESEVPDVYADQFLMTSSVWGVNLTFGKTSPQPPPAGQAPTTIRQTVVRMSLQHAKIMAMIMRKQLKKQERESGVDVVIPHEVYNSLELSSEDW